MPLVRSELRNEYGLGNPDLYRDASRREDPKEVLEGVAISGLVGILRQLGDLAGFASEVFRDLHEQVVATSARGHRVMDRLQQIEAALPQIENAVQNQKSHIHFAHIPGHVWHCNIEIEHYHLLGSNLPQFIMDSYEECRDPPHLFLLDKFDRAGAGACLKRYSDPTYFRRTMTGLEMIKEEKVKNENKAHINKWKETRMLSKKIRHAISLSHYNGSIQLTSLGANERRTTEGTIPKCDMRSKSDIGSQTAPFNLTTKFSCKEPLLNVNSSAEPEESTLNEPKSMSKTNSGEERLSEETTSTCDIRPTSNLGIRSASFNSWKTTNFICEKTVVNANSSAEPGEASFNDPFESKSKIDNDEEHVSEHNSIAEDNSLRDTLPEKRNGQSERTEFSEDNLVKSFHVSESPMNISSQLKQESESAKNGQSDQEEIPVHIGSMSPRDDLLASLAKAIHYDEVTSEVDNYVDAPYAFESETDTDSEFQTIREVKPSSIKTNQTENLTDDMQEMDLSKSDIVEVGYSSMSENIHKESSPNHSNSISFEMVNNSNATLLVHDKNVSVGTDFGVSKESYLLKSSGKNEVSDEQSSQSSISDVQSQSSGSNVSNLPFEDEKIVDPDNAQETWEISEEPSFKIWTNGGILGLEPSKPINQVSSTYGTCTDGCNYSGTVVSDEIDNDGSSEKDEIIVPDCSKTGHDNFQKLQCTTIYHIDQNPSRSEIALCENESPAASVKVSSTELCPKDICISSSLPALAPKFLASNLHNSALLDHDQTRPSSMMPTSNVVVLQERSFLDDRKKSYGKVASQQCHEYVMNHIEETISSRSQYHGPPSPPSPPLEHMKISFHPINSMVASKLKLEFPDGHLHENVEELMFPSFQILQGSAASTHHLSSDSDDDTFYRSSPSCSENIPSRHSDSDFEVWELEDRPGTRSHDMLDTLHPVSSSSASISNSSDFNKMNHHLLQTETDNGNLRADENGTTSFQSGHAPDLPCLDSLESLNYKQEEKYDPGNSESQDFSSSCTNEQPLPALLHPHLENEQHCLSEVANSSANPDLDPKKSVKQQSEQAACMPPEPLEPAQVQKRNLHRTMSMIECHQINGNEEVAKAKDENEMEEFLHEIVSKSFNLKQTVRARSDFAPELTTNSNVVAILEKAEAIHQVVVVASGDEGGDSWSDC